MEYMTEKEEKAIASLGRKTYTPGKGPRLIPNVKMHNELNFYFTQFLTGHEVFESYTRKIGKQSQEETCHYTITPTIQNISSQVEE